MVSLPPSLSVCPPRPLPSSWPLYLFPVHSLCQSLALTCLGLIPVHSLPSLTLCPFCVSLRCCVLRFSVPCSPPSIPFCPFCVCFCVCLWPILPSIPFTSRPFFPSFPPFCFFRIRVPVYSSFAFPCSCPFYPPSIPLPSSLLFIICLSFGECVRVHPSRAFPYLLSSPCPFPSDPSHSLFMLSSSRGCVGGCGCARHWSWVEVLELHFLVFFDFFFFFLSFPLAFLHGLII